MIDLFDLSRKRALVTGASGGIGRSIAIGLAQAGADVAVLGCRRSPYSTSVEVQQQGRRSLSFQGDISNRSFTEGVIEALIQQWGSLDILVNCAGINIRHSSLDFPEEDWKKVIDINLNAIFSLCQSAGREMVRNKHGKVINIASVVSFSGGINVAAYAASKGAVSQITKSLANEWARYNVNVNAIAPGYIETDMTRELIEDSSRYQEILRRIPAQRWGKPDDLVGAAIFLASQASMYVHGHILTVDGGWMAR